MMTLMICLILILFSTIMTKLFCVLAQNSKLMDKPNERSLHQSPTVRGAGIIFIGLSLAYLPFICYFTNSSFKDQIVLICSIVLLALISFIDDIYQLSAKSRLIIQCLVAFLVALFMRPEVLNFELFILTSPYLIAPFLFFCVIWAINHFNFMDGMDGFCALQALFLCAAYALLFYVHHDIIYQDFCLILISNLIGFLIFNFPPAKVFMGDVGSASLGLITFVIAIIAQQKYQIPILYWFILNGLFLFDATVTLLRRIFNKEKWSAAHRKHAYQRLKQFGVSTRMILLGQIMLNAIFFVFVMLLDTESINLNGVLFFQITLMLVIYFLIEKNFPMYNRVSA